MPTFHFISLGCPKNRVDSEVVLAGLLGRGFKSLDQAPGAEVVIVNTCSFIQPAVEEALDHLLAAAQLKKEGAVRFVVSLGCLPQRYGPDLAEGLSEVDLFVTAKAIDQAAEKIEALVLGQSEARFIDSPARFLYQAATPRTLTTSPGTAYVKIAEGCPNRCAFCTIPAIRGRQLSRTRADILAEIRELTARGVQEINLVAHDLTAFGQDLKPPDSLKELLWDIDAQNPGPAWVRLFYLNPGLVDRELLEIVAGARRVLPYLDLPLQHSVPRLLKRMNRRPLAKEPLAW
ncbi:MAG: radical SAM protein, partial [Deltaproteobacteria bacterium]|nr:radical SAM protein [Deltaproteobacteria bacterium]